jgi:Ca2+-binding RTX toxin-like protein
MSFSRKSSALAGLAGALMTMAALGASPAAAGPSCAEGPQIVGSTYFGTPCDDTIHATAGVSVVDAGPGDDTILPAPIASATPFPGEQWLGVGSQTFEGGPGNDLVFGERGNDTLRGGEGDDRLYGGIGDDLVRGGLGQDQLAGGHGFDSIDGDAGDDYVRGDGTIDRIFDTGGGNDTLSYSTGITPGFGGDMSAFPGFPAAGGERGVRLDLSAGGQNGNNGTASFGGGVDEVEGQSFEQVIGTAFSDYIVGTEDPEGIYGGGGADVIVGGGGNDTLAGGADGDHLDGGTGTADSLDGGPGEDHCEGGETTAACEAKGGGVVLRNAAKISAGFAVLPGSFPRSQLYLVGSSGSDSVTATYAPGTPATVTFEASSTGAFDASPSAAAGCAAPTGSTPERVVCSLASPLESIAIAGMGGADELSTAGFPSTVSVMVLGGAGGDDLLGGDATEDVLVDGDATTADQDTLTALGRDDALLHNAGDDTRLAGDGNDLLLSTSICDGDDLRGEAGRDNGSWARLGEPVQANLELGLAGRPGGGSAPQCGAEQVDTLQTIEDLEGTSPLPPDPGDVLYGNSEPNQLLGWEGPDSYFAAGGDDTILANSGDTDITIDCGDGSDKALIDIPNQSAEPPYADPTPISCELVEEAEVNSFRFKTQLPPPQLPEGELPEEETPTPPTGKVRTDRTAPRTRIASHPPKRRLTDKRRTLVAFRFRANEAGATFRCRIDRRPFKPCRSPRVYKLAPEPHVFRVFAIDRAGNRDRSPAIFEFRIRR